MPQHRQTWIRACILGVGSVCTLCFLFVPWIGRRMVRNDYRNAIPREGVATVKMIVGERRDVAGVYEPHVNVSFRNGLHMVRRVRPDDLIGLKEGQPARIVYRIGRSGRVYVDSVRALASP